MSTEEGSRSERNIDRNRLLMRMMDAKASGNRSDVDNTLAEAKQWLRDNRVGDNAIRKAQFQLYKAFPPSQ
jgi:hypothetical protein